MTSLAWGLAVAGVLAAALGRVRRTLIVVTIEGRSMEPTFDAGDRVLARRAPLRRVRTGDVVVVGPAARPEPGTPRLLIIKRAAAVPGDPVPREAVPALAGVAEDEVPRGKLVLLGDSPLSVDSRQHGYVDGERLIGVVVRRLSAGASGPVPAAARRTP
jgi:signal peptidase I